MNAFRNQILYDVARPRQGLATTNNELFLRLWYEVSQRKIGWNLSTSEAALESRKKWFPVTKGGTFRRWYGNNEYIVNYRKVQTARDGRFYEVLADSKSIVAKEK